MAGLKLFHKKYTIRRFGKQEIQSGYAVSPSTDFEHTLNIQPDQPDETTPSSEGGRLVKRLKAYGAEPFMVVNQRTGHRGDWLYYQGSWYCCTSCITYDHTLLHHYKSEWEQVGETEPQECIQPPRK